MVHAQKTLELRRVTAAEIMPFVVRAARYDTTRGTADLQAVAQNGAAFILMENDQPIFGYTLEVQDRAAVITAASGGAEIELTEGCLRMIELQVKGCRVLRFHTIRRGLVRKAEKVGFTVQETIDGEPVVYIMQKGLQ